MLRLRRAVKRAADVALSGAALVVLAPVLAGVAAAVRRQMGSPVLFRHVRPGRRERPFTLYKFRTMRAPAYPGEPDADRLTPLGRRLRRTSLDELPELVNVLRGDMSLVGPRPLLTRYLPYYTDAERVRHSVRPGLTGWAQVHGRNAVSWDERLALDAWYVRHWSLRLDARILLRTVRLVWRGEGVVEAPATAMRDLDEERRAAATP